MTEPNVPPPPPSSGSVSPNRTIMIVLAYLFPLSLIPLLVEKEDREVQWHAKHGVVLGVAYFVILIGLFVLSGVIGAMSGGAGCLISVLFPILVLGFFIFIIMCIVKGVNGQRLKIPGLSDFADKF